MTKTEPKSNWLEWIVAGAVAIPVGLGALWLADRIAYTHYDFQRNHVKVDDGASPFAGYVGGETIIQFADGTTANIPTEMSKEEIITYLQANYEHSRMNSERE